jgi:multiple sugar transport system permease protein
MRFSDFIRLAGPSLSVTLLLLATPLVVLVVFSCMTVSFGQTARFVGYENYARIFGDPRFWRAMSWTALYTLAVVVLQLGLGTLLALALNRIHTARGLFMSLILSPFAVTPVVAALIFAWMVKDYWGLYSWLAEQGGLYIEWFASEWGARWLLIVFKVWTSTPFVALVIFAGLQSLDCEPIEAAMLDGANAIERFVFVVLPMLSPIYMFVIVILLMDAWREFDSVFVMTEGGPAGATETLVYLSYQAAFVEQSIGRGAAISVVTVVGVGLLLSVPLRSLFRRPLGH